MAVTFRAKLLAGHVLLVLVVGLLVFQELHRTLSADLHAQLAHRLESQARGAALWMKQNRHPEKLVRRLAAVVGARVTILSAAGGVLADSETDESGVPPPSTDGADRLVHATAIEGDLVLQLSAPLSDIDATVSGMRRRLLYASLLGLAAALALAIAASRVAARPLRAMTEAADRIARGDYDIRLPPSAPDEFGVLARALSSLAAQLQRDMDRIAQLERVRRDFVANLSHELRTPVTAIQGYAETLLDGAADAAQAKEFLEALHRHATRIARLVAGLLRLSALEARPTEELVREPVDVAAIARHVVGAAQARAPERDKDVAVDLPPALTALGDPMGVEQVLDNLVDNAFRYGGRDVRIEGARVGDAVLIRVIDDGAGIEPDALPRVFERFYRARRDGRRREEGTGLGLAIVKHLCEAMGGSVRAESAPGRTSFEVSLPAADPA
jgi:signal transduction histidine kinase